MDIVKSWANTKTNKCITFFMIYYPVLSIYMSPVSGVIFSDFLLCLFLPYLVIKNFYFYRKIKYNTIYIFTYMCVIILNLIYIYLFKDKIVFVEVWQRSVKYSIYLLFLVICFKQINLNYFKATYIKASLFFTSYLFLQFILYRVFKIFMPGYLTFLPIDINDLASLASKMSEKAFFRPTSLFPEPSLFCTYILGALVLCIFEKNIKKKEAILLTLGLLLSLSSTGIILGGFVWFIYYVKNSSKKINFKKSMNYIVIAVIGVLFLVKSEIFSIFIRRLSEKNSMMGRVYGYIFIYNEYVDNPKNLIFGSGMRSLSVYLPGILRIIYYFGLMGLLYLVIIFKRIYKKSDNTKKKIVILFIILNIGTEILFGPQIFVYFPLLFLKKDNV